jgi:hypothetical protein
MAARASFLSRICCCCSCGQPTIAAAVVVSLLLPVCCDVVADDEHARSKQQQHGSTGGSLLPPRAAPVDVKQGEEFEGQLLRERGEFSLRLLQRSSDHPDRQRAVVRQC